MTQRLSQRVRFEVFKRDRFTCAYCGKRPPEVMLEVDHVVPICAGGSDDILNLVTACVACNRGKAGVPLGNVAPAVDEMALLESAQAMLERAEALRRASAAADAQRKAEEEAIDTVAGWYEEAVGSTDYFEDESIRRFLLELRVEDLHEAVTITGQAVSRRTMHSRRAWLYFCRICWNWIYELRGEGGDDATP